MGEDPDRRSRAAAGGALTRRRSSDDTVRNLHALAGAYGIQSSYRDAAGRTRRASEGPRYAESTLRLPVARLPLGYHRLHIEAPGISARALVISAPSTAPRPGEDGRPRRSWGVFVPLYALRSENSWGAGDFGD